MPRALLMILSLGLVAGCQPDKPKGDLPPLHPVKGKVVRVGAPVAGGLVQFRAEPPQTDLIVNAEVKADGSFELSTLHALSQKKAAGAPIGTYKVTYMPAATDQNITPVTPTQTYTVREGPNDLTIELGKK